MNQDEEPNEDNEELNEDDRARVGRSVSVGFDFLFDLAILALKPTFSKRVAPTDLRIGVFGPYVERGPEVIESIMKYLSSKGLGAVTGKYYVRPNDLRLRLVRRLYPRAIRYLASDLVPTHKWLHEFPRLVSKSIVYLTMMRAQGNEIEGCSDYRIPMLGFILSDEISRERNVCNYLVEKDTYAECVCPDWKLCDRVVKPFCPFYESVHVPWSIKKLFLDSDRLIAARNLEDLKPVIDEFVGASNP